MLLDDFDYILPPELIAQQPSDRRDASRLMTLERRTGTIEETSFRGIPALFREGDLLVVNDTRVIPARLTGCKESGGRVEVFLVRKLAGPGEMWHCLVKASKPPKPGMRLFLPEGLVALVAGRGDDELWTVSFSPVEGFEERLERAGSVPLPPYIKRPAENHDRERYQTVFARVKGAVAAPTAGLHMTAELLDAIRGRGVEIVPLTLHVGLGTFMPVRVEDPREHRMHREHCAVPEMTAVRVNAARREGRRVVALGTTTARALEYASTDEGVLKAGDGEADIFIYPGYRFKAVDALITNFHLPKSTLLMLVSAFAGKELLFRAYADAVRRGFRFFSYGDAMFIH
ncbi:MAG TPA: tRNA preQ1(34) S-adenosylmethionine ribosyltransferase-isomerase QueA [Geobacteraceae bacterium]